LVIAGQSSAIIALAIARQSSAIITLVAHLASQSGDILGDLTAGGPYSSTTKGVHRRKKIQSDLAHGNSTFYLQMMQQLYRRLNPAKPVPQTEAELQHLSVLLYLERQGGFKNQREMGLLAWIVGHALDAASSGDFSRTKEILALMMVSLEQSVVDRGDWSPAYMLCLLEEPPLQVFQERTTNLLHNARPFGPLVPPQWMAVCLQYLKDLEVLATKKNETYPSCSDSCTRGRPRRGALPKEKAAFPEAAESKVYTRCMSQDPRSRSVSEHKDVKGRPHKLNNGGLLNKSNLGSCPFCKVQVCDGSPCKNCGFHPNAKVPGIYLSTDLDTLCFAKWCSLLTTSVLRTRTPFLIFLRATLYLKRSLVTSSSRLSLCYCLSRAFSQRCLQVCLLPKDVGAILGVLSMS